jgi:hypothetical protein
MGREASLSYTQNRDFVAFLYITTLCYAKAASPGSTATAYASRVGSIKAPRRR